MRTSEMAKHNSKSKTFFRYKRPSVLATFAVMLVAMYFQYLPVSQGAGFTFTQTDWSGGATADTATHTADQTGWTEFSQKDSGVSTTAVEATLGQEAIGKSFSTDIDFNGGANSNTDVVGVDEAAAVGLLGSQVTQIASGGYHTCALKNDGTVFCWGSNSSGQLGDNSTTQRLIPVQVVGAGGVGMLSDVSQIEAGYAYTCALKSDSSVFCWGANSNGQLGDNTITTRLTPTQVLGVGGVGTLADVSQIAVGNAHTCALKNDNSVFCWGLNSYGQLGDNSTTQRLVPVQVMGVGGVGVLDSVSQIEMGYGYSCASRADSSVVCWGYNAYGQLGDNSIINKLTPIQVLDSDAIGYLSDVSQISGGGFYTCALKNDGTMYCWGRNNNGQLGDNSNVDKYVPGQVLGVGAIGTLADVEQIEAGYSHACAAKTDGSLFCWGYGGFGQIGDGTITNKLTPVQVLGVGAVGTLAGITQVRGGYVHTCALGTDGTVFCWGYNGMGQLGDGSTVQKTTPVQSQVSLTYLTPGIYTSSVADLSEAKNFTTLAFTETVPANTTLSIDVRAGNAAVPDGTWTAWQNDITDGGSLDALDGNRYVQFRTNLATADIYATPTLEDITFRFTASQNLVSSAYDSETAGASLTKLQWSETRPANTDVLFQLRTSSDGLAWSPWCGPDDGNAGVCDSAAYFTDSTGDETIDDTQKDQVTDRYFQYKLTLSSTDGINVPALTETVVSYNLPDALNVTTDAVSDITPVSATGNGNLIATGGENPERFIEWGTTSGTYTDFCTAGTAGTGAYSCDLTGLAPETTYYYRAKVENSTDTAYGVEQSFLTEETTTTDAPTITSIDNAQDDSLELNVSVGLAEAGQTLDFTIEITDQDQDETETSHQTRTADADGNVTLTIE
ncbi:MAG: hypothetical protein Q8K92_02755, partial [Leadbetterella sp.]|nr:hypothetical protein [Leadbetterella sp.]